MTHIRKAALICDKCGERIDIDPSVEKPFFSSFTKEGTEWEKWMEAYSDHHLCPACAKAYRDRKAEMDAELKKLAGIETVSFDI